MSLCGCKAIYIITIELIHADRYAAHSPSGLYSGRLHPVLCILLLPSTRGETRGLTGGG